MLDANDYADPIGNLPPSERCLIPQHWRAQGSLDKAHAAGRGPMSVALSVRADHGRWVVQCPDCGDAQLAAANDPKFMCVGCGNAAAGGRWRPVLWPRDHVEIGRLLDQRTRDLANWVPGETVKSVTEENHLLSTAHRLDSDDPTGNPFHPNWQGHTHTWPRTANNAGALVCEECALVVSADVFEQEGA